jgi:hypothetical protein
MVTMTVVIDRMSKIATCHVPRVISSANRVDAVFWRAGDAMAMPTVRMEAMKIQLCAVSHSKKNHLIISQ